MNIHEMPRHISLDPWSHSEHSVLEYLKAVDDTSPLYMQLHVVPPIAIVAHVLREILSKLDLPSGTIHTGQEISFMEMAQIGQNLHCLINLSRPFTRKDWTHISAKFHVKNNADISILTGRTAVMITQTSDVKQK